MTWAASLREQTTERPHCEGTEETLAGGWLGPGASLSGRIEVRGELYDRQVTGAAAGLAVEWTAWGAYAGKRMRP